MLTILAKPQGGPLRPETTKTPGEQSVWQPACSSTWETMNPRAFLGSRLPQLQGHGGVRSFSSAISPLLPPPHPGPEEVHGICFWPWVDGRTQAKLQGWTWNGTDASASVFPGGVGAAPGAFHVLFPGDKRGRERSYEGLLSVC